jgi:hypothetical protein
MELRLIELTNVDVWLISCECCSICAASSCPSRRYLNGILGPRYSEATGPEEGLSDAGQRHDEVLK